MTVPRVGPAGRPARRDAVTVAVCNAVLSRPSDPEVVGGADRRIRRCAGRTDRSRYVRHSRRLGAPEDLESERVLGPSPVAEASFGLAFSAGHGKPVSLRRIFEILKADRPGRLSRDGHS